MAIDKRIDYVDQDGYKNYTKNSDSVTVPRKFKARKNAPGTKLAYITDAEEKQLKKQNPGTPHKGPSNVPSYDSFDADRSFTSGAAMSAAETGSRSAADRREVRASNIGAPSGAGPGVRSNQEQDLRSAAIAAGAGQRVNPGFFDSRNVISPAELARAKAFSRDRNNLFARQAMRNTRGGGLMGFLTSGGILGNIIRSLGQRFGLGRTYDQPTYDMRGIVGSVNPDYYNDLDNELMLSTTETPTIQETNVDNRKLAGKNYTYEDGIFTMRNPLLNFIQPPGQVGDDYFLQKGILSSSNAQDILRNLTDKIESGQELSLEESNLFDETVAAVRGY